MPPKVTKEPIAPKLRLTALLFLCLAVPALLPAQQTITVGPSGTYQKIQQGIDAANAGDTVAVSAGTYVENIDFKSKAITVSVANTSPATVAIIDGNGGGPVVTLSNIPAPGASLVGFTIQNGGKPLFAGNQGGIFVNNSFAMLDGLTLKNNFCAGINALASAVIVTHADISLTSSAGCLADEGLGSGIAIIGNQSGSQQISEILFSSIHDNTMSVSHSGDTGGGGAINITSAPTVVVAFTKMYNNVSKGYGGAFYIATTPTLIFENNLVYGNQGISGGLDIVVPPGPNVGPLVGVIANNTIAENTATSSNAGSDIYISGNLAQYALINNIVVGYTKGQFAVNCGTSNQQQTVTPLIFDHNDFYSVPNSGNMPLGGFCNLATNFPSQLGNISKDPLFVHGAAADITSNTADFSLQSASPVIDAGNNSVTDSVGNLIKIAGLDIANNPRIVNGTGGTGEPEIDMGAYEYQMTTPPPARSDTVITLSPSSYTPASNHSVTITASLLSETSQGAPTAPTGTVDFYEDYAVVGHGTITAGTTPGAPGTATFVLKNLTQGLHNLQAVYPAQNGFASGLSVDVIISVTVGITSQTTTTIKSSLNPSTVGQTVTFSTNVSSTDGIPSGSIDFTADSIRIGTVAADASGNASIPDSALTASPNPHLITATFLPSDTSYATSSASLQQQVNTVPLVPTTSVLTVNPANSNFGDPVTLTAKVSPTTPSTGAPVPTGSVAFFDETGHIGNANLVNGVATLTTGLIGGGAHNVSCTYDADSVYAASTCNVVPVNITAVASKLVLSSMPNPGYALTPFTVTATLTANGQPIAGTITYTVNGVAQPNLTADASGHASFTLTEPTGSYLIDAHSVATTNYNASEGTLTETVKPNPTSMTILINPSPGYQNQNIAIVASVLDTTGAASPFGTVTLLDGGAPIATLQTPASALNNSLASVTFNVATLSAGNHQLSATFAPGNNNFLSSSTTGAQTLTILPSDFTLSTSVPSTTIQTEHHGTLTLTATSVGNWSGYLTLTCGPTLPQVLTCSFTQPQVLLKADGNVSTTVRLETDAIANFVSLDPQRTQPHGMSSRNVMAFAALLPLSLFALARRRRLGKAMVFTTFCAFLSMLSLSGCSGKYPDHTPAGTYDIALTATGTANGATMPTTKTIHFTLVVTP